MRLVNEMHGIKVGDIVCRAGTTDLGRVIEINEDGHYNFKVNWASGHNTQCHLSVFDLDYQGEQMRDDVKDLPKQVGGSHYQHFKIQPVDYIADNQIPYLEGNVIKYVSRWRNKNGVEDLEKAKHYLEILIEKEKSKQ